MKRTYMVTGPRLGDMSQANWFFPSRETACSFCETMAKKVDAEYTVLLLEYITTIRQQPVPTRPIEYTEKQDFNFGEEL